MKAIFDSITSALKQTKDFFVKIAGKVDVYWILLGVFGFALLITLVYIAAHLIKNGSVKKKIRRVSEKQGDEGQLYSFARAKDSAIVYRALMALSLACGILAATLYYSVVSALMLIAGVIVYLAVLNLVHDWIFRGCRKGVEKKLDQYWSNVEFEEEACGEEESAKILPCYEPVVTEETPQFHEIVLPEEQPDVEQTVMADIAHAMKEDALCDVLSEADYDYEDMDQDLTDEEIAPIAGQVAIEEVVSVQPVEKVEAQPIAAEEQPVFAVQPIVELKPAPVIPPVAEQPAVVVPDRTVAELIDRAAIVKDTGESAKTMQEVALLLAKERDKKQKKSPEEQRMMNDALADLLRSISKK